MRVVAPALRPWVEGVDQLVEAEHVLALARILDRLLPPRQVGRADRAGAPDGIGGFGRRGPVERLVPSAWAVAKLAPLEFLRRFTQQELLYSELQRRSPVEGRRVVLAFDVGPDQLGVPRLAQLALWVALATRAARAGDELVPVLLQEPEMLMPSGLARAGVRAWSDGRARVSVDPALALRAVQRCGPWRPNDRLWWVSPAAVPPEVTQAVAGRGAAIARVALVDDPDGADRRVAVTIRQAGRRAEVRLPPIDPHAGAILLRDPLRRREVARTPGDPWFDELLWAPSGRRVMAHARNGRWVAVAVPRKGTHQVLKTSKVPVPPVPLVALGWARGHGVAIGYEDGHWVRSGLSHAIAPGPAPPPGMGVVVSQRGPLGTWIAIGGELFRWVEEASGPRVVSLGRGHLRLDENTMWVLRREGDALQQTVVGANGREEEARRVVGVAGSGVTLGDGSVVVLHERTLTSGRWTYVLPDGHDLVGVLGPEGRRGVVTIDGSRRIQHVVPPDGLPQDLGTATGPVALGPQGCVAWLDGRQLHVMELGTPLPELRVQAPGRIP